MSGSQFMNKSNTFHQHFVLRICNIRGKGVMFVAAQMLYYEYQISYIRYHASSSFFSVLTPPVSFWGTVGNLVKHVTLFHPFPRCVPPHPLVNSNNFYCCTCTVLYGAVCSKISCFLIKSPFYYSWPRNSKAFCYKHI